MNKISLTYVASKEDLAYSNSALQRIEMYLDDGHVQDVIKSMFMFMTNIGYTPESIFNTVKDIADNYDASNFTDYFYD